ncbi:hypothetical protein CTN06_02125 [Pectobacterium zantedeschiae]|uniref:Bacteriophage protein n=1 Tax=Pectobacterium zantedeschiae TaxID=2034769 RepID=A0A9X8JKS0_9GAMM|nr:hypothetical protein CLR69_06320 [Pectobacterium zantedeschiae]RYC49785.1 hypothetical protein CTN06_02125 [Pectobacterium zantedeschiae]
MAIKLPGSGYAVVRCRDHVVVATFKDFPEFDRALTYRRGDTISFMPLQPEEIVGTPTLFTQMLERAGYLVSQV